MKYFTRQRFRATQTDSRAADRDWKKAGQAYAKHVRDLRPELPRAARELSRHTFHDSVVRSLERRGNDRIILTLDATNNPWGPRGTFRLELVKPHTFLMRGPIVGDWWLYEEFHRARAGFALHVLLHRSSMIVSASDVVLTKLKTVRRPTSGAA